MQNIPRGYPVMVWPVGNGYRVRRATLDEYQKIEDGGIVFPTQYDLMLYLQKHFDLEAIKSVTA